MSDDPRWHSRHYLPHFEAGETAQMVTFRLADTLPQSKLNEWRQALKSLKEKQLDTELRKRTEAWLDSGVGACWLNNRNVAEVVENALLHFDRVRYRFHAWVIMPNHVHVVMMPLEDSSLSSILHTWKSFSAHQANRILKRHGPFWQSEYFDRWIRDDRHFTKAVDYTEWNPVNVGLCARPADWPFGSARLR